MTKINPESISLYNGTSLSFQEIRDTVVCFVIRLRRTNIITGLNARGIPISHSIKQIHEKVMHSDLFAHLCFFKSVVINMSFLNTHFTFKKINRSNIILFYNQYGIHLKRDIATQISGRLKKLRLLS